MATGREASLDSDSTSDRAASAVGTRVWFDQADQFHPSTNPPEMCEALLKLYGDSPFDMPPYSCFGDGTPIPDDVLKTIREVMSQHEVAFPWQAGDLMVVETMLTAPMGDLPSQTTARYWCR